MAKKAGAWLLLISSIAGDNKAARQRIWRALKAGGAATLRDGVYVLPQSGPARRAFAEQADVIAAAGGSAQVLAACSASSEQELWFKSLFDRGERYAGLVAEIDRIGTGLSTADENDARRDISALRRDLLALVAIDFFPGAPRRQVERALADLETAFNGRFSPGEPHASAGQIPKRDIAGYQGRTWATRERPWVDRVASAWLIRRFIDPKARFAWLKTPKDCPKKALGFDFDGAEFTHVGARVTFEVLAASFGLDRDPGIARIGRLVHCLDIGGVPVPEAAGFTAILAGARATHASDDELLEAMSTTLDALHAAFQQPQQPADDVGSNARSAVRDAAEPRRRSRATPGRPRRRARGARQP